MLALAPNAQSPVAYELQQTRVFARVSASKTPAENSAALVGAVATLALISQNGGIVVLPGGTFTFANTGPGELGGSGATSWDNRYCVRVTDDNIFIKGAGRGVTRLKLADDENAHVIQFGQRVGASQSVSGGGVFDLEIDGNRANQETPTDSDNHFDGINVATGAVGIHLERLYIHDTAYYGIGFQRDSFHNNVVRDVVIENTGADGIDAKDDSDANTGNVLEHIRVRNWGLVSTLSVGQAAIDLRSGWTGRDLDVGTPGSSAALNGIRLQNGTPGATPVQPTRINAFRILGSDTANSVGFRAICRYCTVSDGYVKDFADGYSLSNPDLRFSQLIAESNATGFRFWQDSGASVEADTNTLIGLVARSNTENGVVCDSVDELTFLGCDVRGNTTCGYDIRAGCSNIRVLGGSASGNGTNILDNGTNTTITNVSGVRTQQRFLSAGIAIDSTGAKTVTFNHTLAYTPNPEDVRLTLQRDTAVSDWTLRYVQVVSVSSTQIVAELNVLTASATGGATVKLSADVAIKRPY